MNKRRLVKQLEHIVGKRSVIHHPDDLLVFEYDGSVDRGLPAAVVFPASTGEVSRIVELAGREGLPVIPRGAGTRLSAGAIALRGWHKAGSDQDAFHSGDRPPEQNRRGRARRCES